MAQATNDLQQLKGIGRVLAQRLQGAGITTFQDIMEAGEEGLRGIPGIKNGSAAGIVEQAKKTSGRMQRVDAIKGRISTIRERVSDLAEGSRERFGADLESKRGKKVTGELDSVVEVLNVLHDAELKRLKRTERGLDKAERRMRGLDEAKLGKVRKGLKKSKKALMKALP